ncbi:MAG: nucleotidyltransferase domain-containing protein [Eubacteriales bacterium]|nr:nucleotidyltransferase domain-containing protein [Eubacteriales bacterium]
MNRIKDEQMRIILSELADRLYQVYENRLKAVIVYGSVARGTETKDSDVDIMVLVDGNNAVLRAYSEKLSDVSAEISLRYLKVFSIIDISYQEYIEWKQVSPFYKNVAEEGVVLYAA